MQPFVDPARKLRAALSDCTSTHPTLDYFIRLAFRLPTDENGHRDYRNTDPQTRQTSLHFAALKGRTDVFEWFLEEGVDEGEVSRVSSARSMSRCDSACTYQRAGTRRTSSGTQSCTLRLRKATARLPTCT